MAHESKRFKGEVADTTSATALTNATFLAALKRRAPIAFIDLPVEVHRMILKEAHECDPTIALSVTLLSKRFRDLAVQIPKLWTTLGNGPTTALPPSVAVLERRKGSEIDVELDINPENPARALQHVSHLKSVSDKWRRLHLYGDLKESNNSYGPLSQLRGACENLVLPNLKAVIVSYSPSNDELNEDSVKGSSCLTSSWTLPELRYASYVNVIPAVFKYGTPTLTHVNVRIHEPGTTQRRYDLSLLAEFLGSVPTLSHLHLDFVYLGDCFSEREPEDIQNLELPNLVELKVTYILGDPYEFAPFMNALSLPRLKKLEAKVGISARMSAKRVSLWMKTMLAPLKEENDLMEFSFETVLQGADPAVPHVRTHRYRLPLAKIRNVRHLALRTSAYYPAATKPNDILPTVQTLRLEGIRGLTHQWFARFAENLRSGDGRKWSELKEVWIAQCAGIDRGVLLEIFLGKKVYYEGTLLEAAEHLEPAEANVVAEAVEPEAPQPAPAGAVEVTDPHEAVEATGPLETVDPVNHLAATEVVEPGEAT